MASDDDVKTGLDGLERFERESRRVARARLPQFLGEGSSGVSPKAKTASAKPLSMLKDEEEKMREGGLGHIGKGDQTVTFNEWIRKLNGVIPFLGKDLPYKSQVVAGEAVAGILRKFLLEGVDPQLSGMTTGLHKNRLGFSDPNKAARPLMDHDDRRVDGMALAALAPHIKVNRPPKMRTRGAKAKNGKPGYPGVFAKGYAPCTISFDSESVDKIAYVLEHGRIWKPPNNVRKALVTKAIEGGWQPTEKSTTGYWEIPPRPFSHVLVGSEAQRVVRQVAEAALMGKLKQEMAKRKELYEDAMSHAGADVDALSDVLADDSADEDWTDLIEFGPRKKR